MKLYFKESMRVLGAWEYTNHPKILGITSDICNVGSTVSAIVGTIKANKRVAEAKFVIEDVQRKLENHEVDELEAKKLVRSAMRRTALAVSACYAPAVILTAGSLLLHNAQVSELARRQAEVIAAYETLRIAYDNLVKRTKNAVGDETAKCIEEGLVKREDAKEGEPQYISEMTPEEAEQAFIFYFDPTTSKYAEHNLDMCELFLRNEFTCASYGEFMEYGFLRPNEFMTRMLGMDKIFKALDNFVWVYDKDDEFATQPAYELTRVQRKDANGMPYDTIQMKLKNLQPIAKAIEAGYIVG